MGATTSNTASNTGFTTANERPYKTHMLLMYQQSHCLSVTCLCLPVFCLCLSVSIGLSIYLSVSLSVCLSHFLSVTPCLYLSLTPCLSHWLTLPLCPQIFSSSRLSASMSTFLAPLSHPFSLSHFISPSPSLTHSCSLFNYVLHFSFSLQILYSHITKRMHLYLHGKRMYTYM